MSKKHFIALAQVLMDTKPQPNGPTWDYAEAILQWERIRNALADFCEDQNPRFNRERWLGFIAGENGPNGGKV